MNYISLTGSLLNISSENKNIRYIKYVRTYKDKKGIFQEDIFPCMWWTRDSNNELFSLQDNIIWKEKSYTSRNGIIPSFNIKAYL